MGETPVVKRLNTGIKRGEMVETNCGCAIDNVVLDVPLLIFEARCFREDSEKKESRGLGRDLFHSVICINQVGVRISKQSDSSVSTNRKYKL